MSDISLQLRELCQLHEAGQLSKAQFEKAKDAVIEAALAQAAAASPARGALPTPNPRPSMPTRSPYSPPPQVSFGTLAHTTTPRSALRKTALTLVLPQCPGGHGTLDLQTKESVPATWRGRVSCSQCASEGDAKDFLGCRLCDYDLCPSCTRKFETPLKIPSPVASVMFSDKIEPSPLSQVNYSPAAPSERVVTPPTAQLKRTNPLASIHREGSPAQDVEEPITPLAVLLEADDSPDNRTQHMLEESAKKTATEDAAEPVEVEADVVKKHNVLETMSDSDASFASVKDMSMSLSAVEVPNVAPEPAPAQPLSVFAVENSSAEDESEADVVVIVKKPSAEPVLQVPKMQAVPKAQSVGSDEAFASLSSPSIAHSAASDETVTKIRLTQPRMNRMLKRPPDPPNFQPLPMRTKGQTKSKVYHGTAVRSAS